MWVERPVGGASGKGGPHGFARRWFGEGQGMGDPAAGGALRVELSRGREVAALGPSGWRRIRSKTGASRDAQAAGTQARLCVVFG